MCLVVNRILPVLLGHFNVPWSSENTCGWRDDVDSSGGMEG